MYKDKWLANEKVFRDPVHNYIQITHQLILDLIDTKEFQRLRRIKQLGGSSYTFHGGEHTRFSHSLGVYENARHICDIFSRKYPIEKEGENGWDDSERLVTLAAALLHDIGHGAYSHTFEQIFHTNHEEFTAEIILSEKTEINAVLQKMGIDFPQKVASVIQKTYPNPQVVQMISSQIDADRMDYLLRDAYFTGTQYGFFDLTRITRVIRPYKDGIAFLSQGMHAVEDYIVSRYQMYMQIYFHPTSRAMDVLLVHLLKRAKFLYNAGGRADLFLATSPRLIPFLKGDYNLYDYLKLDDGVLNTYFSEWSEDVDEILSDLAKRYRNRKPLSSIIVKDEKEHLLPTMRRFVEEFGYNADYYTITSSSMNLPYDFYRPNDTHSLTQIEIMRKDGTLVELSTLSPLVRAITGESVGDRRFFFPKEMLQKTDGQLDLLEDVTLKFQKHVHNGELV
ncbi:MAG: HD domain-containing protein [Streptococcaceae bacterium]|jgi:HD superfamily phosphohydrolase|nr:HD domain-containing protein [Streptococcaceae bacterium]